MTNAGSSKKVVTMGGGTGTFTVLSGLRHIKNISLTAIVSSSDDGGSTGRLRDAYGILPLGDARQALVALAEENTVLRDLFTYRFSKGDIAGHSLGNLFLTALTDLLGSEASGIEAASHILRINGKVLSVSEKASTLSAKLSDGTILKGEHAIDTRSVERAPIEELSLTEKEQVSFSARTALLEADVIIFGPGDLYTSTIATLLPSGMSETLKKTKARIIYVMNLFTKAGQTNGYTASRHIDEIERYAGRPIDTILLNTEIFPEIALKRYAIEGESPVKDDLKDDPRVIRQDLVSVSFVEPVPEDPVPRSLVRHDSQKLAIALGAFLG